MQEKPKEKQSGFNWLGILVFLVVFAGPSLWRFIRPIFTGGAGFSLPQGFPLPMVIIGAVVLAVAVAAVIGGVRRAQGGNDSRLPTSLPTAMRPPQASRASSTPRQRQSQTNAPMPPFGGELGPFFPNFPVSTDGMPPAPSRTPQLPRPPQFEPVISGKALLAATGLFGVLGLTYLLVAAVLP